MKETVIPIVIGTLGTVPKSLERRLEELEIRRRTKTIVEIDQNTEESPGYLRRLTVTWIKIKDHQFTLV